MRIALTSWPNAGSFARTRHSGATDWTEYRPWPWEKITFIDGATERGPRVVLRRIDESAKVKFRRYTDEELDQWEADQLW